MGIFSKSIIPHPAVDFQNGNLLTNAKSAENPP